MLAVLVPPMLGAAIGIYVKEPVLTIVLAPVGLLVGLLGDHWAERGRQRDAQARAARVSLAGEPVDALDPRFEQMVFGSGHAASGTDVNAKQVDAVSGDLIHALEAPSRVGEHCVLVAGNEREQRTRTAFEALCMAARRSPDAKAPKVLVPDDSVGPEALVKYLSLEPSFDFPVVLWLDSIDRWLVPGASLTLDHLQRLAELDPPAAVLATIGTRERLRILESSSSAAATAVLRAFDRDHTVYVA